jgi:hypothetical protein
MVDQVSARATNAVGRRLHDKVARHPGFIVCSREP